MELKGILILAGFALAIVFFSVITSRGRQARQAEEKATDEKKRAVVDHYVAQRNMGADFGELIEKSPLGAIDIADRVLVAQIVHRHPQSWLKDEDLTTVIPPYQKSYDYDGAYIDDFHRQIVADGKSGMYAGPIKGRLRTADALKLYELAYFSKRNILELGTYHGLSSWIMANAIRNSGSGRMIVSIDLSKGLSDLARSNLGKAGLGDLVEYRTADGAAGIDTLESEGRWFTAAFIDHSHAYEHVMEACIRLPRVMVRGSPILFHDFNDRRNADPNELQYGVRQAVRDAAPTAGLMFSGVYGCAALYELSGQPGGRRLGR